MHTQCEESNLHVTFLIYDQLCHAPKARNGTLLQMLKGWHWKQLERRGCWVWNNWLMEVHGFPKSLLIQLFV